MTKKTNTSQKLLQQAGDLGLPYGQELSFKLLPGRLLDDRLLLGWQARDFAPLRFIAWLEQTHGLPAPAADALRERAPLANTVGLSIEAEEGQVLFKAYLEFWEPIRARMQAGTLGPEPQLLHYGIKWQAQGEAYAQAEYHVQPQLTAYDIVKRIQALHPPGRHSLALGTANALVQRGSTRAPGAPMLYLEAREAGNARQSCDINLYKTGLRLEDAAPLLRELGAVLGVPAPVLEAHLQAHAALPLGHVAAGTDRHGQDFLSIYLGVRELEP
ncbi:hypothetical protein [Rhodoferax sp. BAB1]|uniref:hypothetical protein n=1 Tax=Rhodoferax sp. BAB1 TaxID=2741720 RepID=UPI00157746B7|nr:hypothetical protein [Rhodoferax sp. BAB1]QKO22394.1 hypothetical protein HTY51_11075 [Rhodoferax sp. BAB1]